MKEEKPYFRDVIDPEDIARVLCVRGRHSNDRLTAQSGAFLLFNHRAPFPETGNGEIAIRRVRVADGYKDRVLAQLDTLASNEGTAFRDISKYAGYIASRD